MLMSSPFSQSETRIGVRAPRSANQKGASTIMYMSALPSANQKGAANIMLMSSPAQPIRRRCCACVIREGELSFSELRLLASVFCVLRPGCELLRRPGGGGWWCPLTTTPPRGVQQCAVFLLFYRWASRFPHRRVGAFSARAEEHELPVLHGGDGPRCLSAEEFLHIVPVLCSWKGSGHG